MINVRGLIVVAIVLACFISYAYPRDNGQYANSPLKGWFETLTDKRGFGCCAMADGQALEDPDWQTTSDPDNPYRVRVNGEWLDVPVQAVITEPNQANKTMLWMVHIYNGGDQVRCFLPGALI